MTEIRLETMTPEDVELRLRTETDPVVMAELGGPRPRADIERAHARSLELAAEGRCWPLKVILDDAPRAVGWIGVFASSHADETIDEIGWTVLPEFQGRGIAGRAVAMVLDQARAHRKFPRIHAFPGVGNAPSNRVCAKNGFVHLGECETEFSGRALRCHHWRVDLF